MSAASGPERQFVLTNYFCVQDSRLYIVNGLLMLATFFLCRVSMFPMLYLWYTRSGLPTDLYIQTAVSPLPLPLQAEATHC
jgi:hypothetical protein